MATPGDLFRRADRLFDDFSRLAKEAQEMHGNAVYRPDADTVSSVSNGTRKFQFSATKNGERVTYTLICETGFPKQPAWWQFWK